MIKSSFTRNCAAIAVLAGTSTAFALSVGQIDTFQGGTTQNWQVGLLGMPHPVPPANIADGGPGGAGDHYLRLSAIGGSGAGSRLSVVNLAQWAGDYIAAGITSIRMDVNNFGTTDLSLRLLLANPVGGPPTDVAISQEPVLLSPGSGWVSVAFPLRISDLLPVAGNVQTALENATELRIFHSVADGFPGETLVAEAGVDNIQAAVPDVAPTFALLACGLAGLWLVPSRHARTY